MTLKQKCHPLAHPPFSGQPTKQIDTALQYTGAKWSLKDRSFAKMAI